MDVFHRLIDGDATMQVKIFGAYSMVDARGPEMDRGESVTLFNDMCLLAPGTLVGPVITWEPVDASSARARFRHGQHTITATLIAGPRLPRVWSPHAPAHGDAQWRLPEGELLVYGACSFEDILGRQ